MFTSICRAQTRPYNALSALAIAVVALVVACAHERPPAGVFPHSTNALQVDRRLTIVCFGDSISESKSDWFGGASGPQAIWGLHLERQLRERYPEATITVWQHGIGGQNSSDAIARVESLAARKPDLVLVAFGANDASHRPIPPHETQTSLTTIIHTIRSTMPADVMVVGSAGDNPLKPFFVHRDETIAASQSAAEDTGVPYVDLRSAMLAATRDGKQWGDFHTGDDNCHPNDRGHVVWASTTLTVLLPLLPAAAR